MKWINIVDEIPSPQTEVMVCGWVNGKYTVGTGYITDNGYWVTETVDYTPDTLRPTHWSILPDNPQKTY